MFHGHSNYFQKPPLGSRPNTKPGDHGTPNAHNHWFILFYHVWGSAWIEIHWNSIWLKARSHMASHYTWGSVTTLHDVGGVLGRHLDTFFWALTISWSRLLTRVWSGPYGTSIGGRNSSDCKPPNQVNSGPNLGGLGPVEAIVYLFKEDIKGTKGRGELLFHAIVLP